MPLYNSGVGIRVICQIRYVLCWSLVSNDARLHIYFVSTNEWVETHPNSCSLNESMVDEMWMCLIEKQTQNVFSHSWDTTPRKVNITPEKMMVGKNAFLLGFRPIFSGQVVKLQGCRWYFLAGLVKPGYWGGWNVTPPIQLGIYNVTGWVAVRSWEGWVIWLFKRF